MKNNHVLFCLLLLITVANNAFAQSTVSPGTRNRMEQLPASLQTQIKRAGFDLQAHNGATDRNQLVLDSTKTFYGYIGTDSTPLYRTVYTYPAANMKVEVSSQYDFGQWYYTGRATTTTDNLQRTLEVHAETYDEGTQTWVNDSRLLVYPHGNSPSLIDSFFAYIWNPDVAEWALLLKGSNYFDAQDRQTESLNYLYFSGTELIFREIYEYDANGDNIRIEEFALIGGVDYPSQLIEFVYDNHQVIETIASAHDGLEYVLQSRRTNTYTNFGAVKTDFSYEWSFSTENWIQTQAVVYDYDAQQRVDSKATTFLHADIPDEFELINYAYIEDEHLASESIYLRFEGDPEWFLDSKTLYYYGGTTSVNPIVRDIKNMAVSPNPTTGRVLIGLDAEAEVRVFNTSGKLLKTMVAQPGQQVDLSDLPTGLYILTAQKELEVYNGKVVKE